MLSKEFFEWRENISSQEWDTVLLAMGGHFLQSAKWGNSRKLTHKINDNRWLALKDGNPIYLVRFEERGFFGLIKIAWIPKGPVVSSQGYELLVHNEFLTRLKKKGFFICATNPWTRINLTKKKDRAFYSIWLDLTIGKEKLWKNLHKQFRYDVKRAKKLGVLVEKSEKQHDIGSFYSLCQSLSQHKGFHFGTSLQMISFLLQNDNQGIESYLFTAKYDEKFCGGAFIIRCGDNIHYVWGAVDRTFSKLSIGEAIQWEIIEWALNISCKKYDLEGISKTQESGVDYFKKKLGGTIVTFPNILIYPLNICGMLLSPLLKIYIKLQPKIRRYKTFLSKL